jgi:competence protein ComGC
MISTKQRTTRTSGFTLIEILVVFLLIMMIIGVGALSLTSVNTKKRIVEPGVELKKFARRGLQMAINNRRSFSIALNENGFVLREGFAQISKEDEDDPRFAPLFEEERENAGNVVDSFDLRDDMRLEVRRWGEKFFREPEDDLWIFEPSGICEPIGVKFIHPEGTYELDFNPLTAKVSDESLIIDGNSEL